MRVNVEWVNNIVMQVICGLLVGGYNYIGPAEEICSGGLDEDCDGLVDL